jgi:hypothetical protein
VDARTIIADLCRRFGVSLEFGKRLRPLVERATRSDPQKRRLILEMIERSFAEEARRADEERTSEALTPEESRVLSTVARVLHGWKPPAWLDERDPGQPGG